MRVTRIHIQKTSSEKSYYLYWSSWKLIQRKNWHAIRATRQPHGTCRITTCYTYINSFATLIYKSRLQYYILEKCDKAGALGIISIINISSISTHVTSQNEVYSREVQIISISTHVTSQSILVVYSNEQSFSCYMSEKHWLERRTNSLKRKMHVRVVPKYGCKQWSRKIIKP